MASVDELSGDDATRCVVEVGEHSVRSSFSETFGHIWKHVNVYVSVNVYVFDGGLRGSSMDERLTTSQSIVYRTAGARSRNANGCALF